MIRLGGPATCEAPGASRPGLAPATRRRRQQASRMAAMPPYREGVARPATRSTEDSAGGTRMAKLWVLLERKPELSMADFEAWWLEHVKLSSRMPGLSRYRINFVREVRPFGVDLPTVRFDGTAELQFASDAEMAVAFRSDVATAAVADTDRVCSRRIEFATDEHVVVPGPSMRDEAIVKVAVLLWRQPELSTDSFRDWWFEHVQQSRLMPGLRGYRINFVNDVRGNGFAAEEFACDGTAELWFDNLEAVEAGFGSAIGQSAAEDAARHCQRRVRYLTAEHVVI